MVQLSFQVTFVTQTATFASNFMHLASVRARNKRETKRRTCILFSTATLADVKKKSDVKIKHFYASYRDKFKDSNCVQDQGRTTKTKKLTLELMSEVKVFILNISEEDV